MVGITYIECDRIMDFQLGMLNEFQNPFELEIGGVDKGSGFHVKRNYIPPLPTAHSFILIRIHDIVNIVVKSMYGARYILEISGGTFCKI